MSDYILQDLIGAAREENLEKISSILSRNPDFLRADFSLTSLIVAIRTQRTDIIELLLENGARVNRPYDGYYYSPLHAAVECGNARIVEMVLKKNAEVDVKDVSGKTALHYAADKGYLRIAEDLLNQGADINLLSSWATYNNEFTPLYFAAEKNHLELVELLISKGADVNFGGKDDPKPVYIATKNGHDKIVKLLLKHGADVDARGKDGNTILNLAVEYKRLIIVEHILKHHPDIHNESNKKSLEIAITKIRDRKIVELLLQYGFSIDYEDPSDFHTLHIAVEEGFSAVVEGFLNSGAEVNAIDKRNSLQNTLLHTAVQKQQANIVKLLIDSGADVNARNQEKKCPIFYAIENSDTSVAKMLLAHGATVASDYSLFHLAIREANREIVEILLQPRYRISLHECDKNHRRALHFTGMLSERWTALDEAGKNAYKSDKVDIARLLLSRGASVDAIDWNGTTALHSAVTSNNTKLVETLLDHNANVNVEDRMGLTPLQFSVHIGNQLILKMLLDRGADVNAIQRDGSTALNIACKRGDERIVEKLLKYGAKFSYTPKRKLNEFVVRRMENPLYIAARMGHREIVILLLKYGVDINSRMPDGQTALHAAAMDGSIEMYRLLMEYGADINCEDIVGETALDFALAGFKKYLDGRPTSCRVQSENHRVISANLEECIVKMKAANLFVSPKNLQAVARKPAYWTLENICTSEINIMQNTKVAKSDLSFYDVLSEDIEYLTMFTRKESIVEVLESEDLELAFPMYFKLMRDNFKRAQRRNDLLCSSIEFMITFSGFILPEHICQTICEYLSNVDLASFVGACENN